MKPWISWTLNGLGLALVGLFAVNAAWLAPPPRGYMKLIAQRGTPQQYSHTGVTDQTCTATRIEPPVHDFIENTITGLQQADRLGANMVTVDVISTADGRLVLLRDQTLDCRTDLSGQVRKTALADLQKRDAGHGYTADGGKTFPLRDSTGRIPTVEEAVAALPGTAILFTLKHGTPAEGALLAKALKAAGRDVIKRGDGFFAPDPVLAPLRQAFPGAWAFSEASAKACGDGYRLAGWFTVVPQACVDGTVFVPIGMQWRYPGWPNRMLSRMAKTRTRVVLIAPTSIGTGPFGVDLPEQIAEVPFDYTGYIWAEDIWTMGPALHPDTRRRSPEAEARLDKAHTARRKARGLPEPQ